MKSYRRLIFVLAFFFLLTSVAGALTFLVDTWVEASLNELEPPRRLEVVAAETGVMDTLFDTGNIFFNIYSTPGNADGARSQDLSLGHAQDIGAPFLLVLTTSADGLSWSLIRTKDAQALGNGFEEYGITDALAKPEDRWIHLGRMAAESAVTLAQGN